eukprot:8645854-Pyramimonas_sp.AAC.1
MLALLLRVLANILGEVLPVWLSTLPAKVARAALSVVRPCRLVAATRTSLRGMVVAARHFAGPLA